MFTFITDNGVFSKGGVDEGTEILLQTLEKEDTLQGNMLDLGCGYGVIGIVCGSLWPLSITCSDVNPRAVELAECNAGKNNVSVKTVVSDRFENIDDRFDVIVTNPPIRAGKKVIYRMFEEARTHLNNGGCFYAVIRRKQGAESALKKLTEVFGNCAVIERERGYWILKSVFDGFEGL